MKRAALLIGWLFMIYGGSIMVAAVVYAFWAMWRSESFALIFGIGDGTMTLLFLSGIFFGAIGLALFSYAKQ